MLTFSTNISLDIVIHTKKSCLVPSHAHVETHSFVFVQSPPRWCITTSLYSILISVMIVSILPCENWRPTEPWSRKVSFKSAVWVCWFLVKGKPIYTWYSPLLPTRPANLLYISLPFLLTPHNRGTYNICAKLIYSCNCNVQISDIT